jgi:glucokinase
MEPQYIGALDIGGTKIAASVAAIDGPLGRAVQPTAKTGLDSALPEQAIALLETVCRDAGIDSRLLKTVGVSSCGPFVQVDSALALATPNICGGQKHSADLPNEWEVIPLQKVLRERFDTLVIENDCVAALVAERAFGAVQDEPNCVYATWSTGIGFGLCVDGHVLRGKHANAGHAGHMLMSEQAQGLCGCGNRGDLEGLISGRNLGASIGKSAPELFAAARAGDPEAREFAALAAQRFGRALYNLAATLDTSVFVIGGSVWANHGEWLAPRVKHEIESRLPALTAGVTVVPAALQGMVADIGAFSLVMPREWLFRWRRTQPWRKDSSSNK